MERRRAGDSRPTTVLGRALRPSYDIGASLPKRVAWYFVNLAVMHNPWLPLSAPRVLALRAFGARVGRNVTIKPQVKVKFPWKLTVGDGAAIGEECWIDNLDQVTIGEGAMLSQRSYLCTGNHDWSTSELELQTAPITVGARAWVGAGVIVGPGAEVGDASVVTVGSVALGKLPPNTICSGNPAEPRKPRFPGPVR
jgi:putative colanic acid biosynthesis acetyltransferase WcaF